MKRINNIWKDVVNPNDALSAVIDGTRFKRGQREVQWLLYSQEMVAENKSLWHRIDKDKAMPYAERLCSDLSEHRWTHKPPRYKHQFCQNRTSNHGKWRDIYIPTLDDHIVAHMVMSASMRAFTRGMHPHCCGSVPKRGIKHVNKTVQRWLKGDKQCRYFVKLDIKKFFDNIDRDILIQVLETKIKDRDVLDVFRQIIDSAPVPCPVGYYTSPWLANLYLEKLDWYVEQQLYKVRRGKRIKYVRHYLRYVDDILLIGTSKADLKKAVFEVRKFLREQRKVDIKDSWEIKAIGSHIVDGGKWKLKPNTYWIDICGYKFCKDSTVMRDGIYFATKRLVKKMSRAEYYTPHQCLSLNSRIGWASHCDSNNFVRNNINPYINITTTRKVIANVDKVREQ